MIFRCNLTHAQYIFFDDSSVCVCVCACVCVIVCVCVNWMGIWLFSCCCACCSRSHYSFTRGNLFKANRLISIKVSNHI